KSMRGILSAVGVRVVANKKKFIVQASIVDAAELELDDVPEDKREEYYEIDIVDNLVTIRSASQQGVVWGTHTYAQLYGIKGDCAVISNMLIRDWSDTPCRGIYLPATSGIAWMRADEIFAVIDRITREKMNVLAFGLYGQIPELCPGARILSEYLFHPFQRDEMKEEIINPPFEPETFSWFSPKYNKWLKETYYPRIIENYGIEKIATYARENSLRFVPAVSFFGKSPLLASIYPELAGQTADGHTSDEVCCLNSTNARNGCDRLISMLLQKALSNKGADDFMLDLNTVPPLDNRDNWCHCKNCKDKKPVELLVNFVTSFAELLFAKEVSQLVFSSTDGRGQELLVDSGLLDRLNEKGWSDKIIIHSEDAGVCRHNETFWGAFFTAAQNGEKMPVPGQVTELISRAQFTGYAGVVANSSPAAYPAPLEAEMGAYLWNWGIADSQEPQTQVLEALCPQHPQELAGAVTPLLEAIESARFMKYCDAVLLKDEGSPMKRAAAILQQAIDGCGEEQLQEMLTAVQDNTKTARECSDNLLEQLNAEESTDESLLAFLQNNAAEAIRLGGISRYLSTLLPYRQKLESETLDSKALQEAFTSAGQELLDVIEELEKRLSNSVAPRILHQLSSLLPPDERKG
ncbi:MAG: hypothetical protein ACOCQP_04050, partial [Lentisphaeria bacterium]